METALTEPRKTEVNDDFTVSTALFASRLETRVFSSFDEIPGTLVKLITEAVEALTLLDSHYVEDDESERYSEDAGEYVSTVTGYSVETYAFADARSVHDAVSATIDRFVNTHTRTVRYV